MGAQSHGQGIPQRPGLASSRRLPSILEHHRELWASIRPIHIVQPAGPNVYLVKNFCNDTVYKMRTNGGHNYSPGSVAFAASNAGHPDEIILTEPAGGRRGASVQGSLTVLRVANFNVEAPSVYGAWLAVALDGGDMVAMLYDGPTFVEELARIAWSAFSATSARLISWSPLVYAAQSNSGVRVWNIDTNTLASASFGSGTEGPMMAAPSQSRGLFRIRGTGGVTRFAFWQVDIAGVLTQLSTPGSEDVAPTPDGSWSSPGQSIFTGADALHPVGGAVGEGGYILFGPSGPTFTQDDAWLPNLLDEWGNWGPGHLLTSGTAIAGQNSVPAGEDGIRVGLITSASVYTELIPPSAGVSSASWWPCPSGTRFGLVDYSAAPKAARLSAVPLVGEIPWFEIEPYGALNPNTYDFFPIDG